MINEDAKQAFDEKDQTASILAHDKFKVATEPHTTGSGQYIKSIIFGGLDGIITTFSIVAGVAGADLSPEVVLVFGFANLLADGLSMGFGDYLSSKAELDYAKTERARELWEYDNFPEGEKEEMVEIYMKNGFSEEKARKAIDILSTNKDFFVDHMMVHELGIMPPAEDESPAKDGLITFVSFLIFGFIPVLAYLVVPRSDPSVAFAVACVLTGATLFILGVVKGKLSGNSMIRSGFMVLLNGAIAAAAAYLIGWALGKATGVSGKV